MYIIAYLKKLFQESLCVSESDEVSYIGLVSLPFALFEIHTERMKKNFYFANSVSICVQMGQDFVSDRCHRFSTQIVLSANVDYNSCGVRSISGWTDDKPGSISNYKNVTIIWRRPHIVSPQNFHFDLFVISESIKWWIFHRTNATKEENYQEIINDTIAYAILMTLTNLLDFIVGIICIDCFNYSALRQVTRIKKKWFESLMRQEIGWFDVASNNDNPTRQLIQWVFELLWHSIV